MVSRSERPVTLSTQEKLGNTLDSFCMYGVESTPRGRMGDLSTNQYAARLSGQIDAIHMEGHAFWTPRGSGGDILLRGNVILERDDRLGSVTDYFLRRLDLIEDIWQVESFIRPLPGAEPAVHDDDIEQIDIFAALEAEEAYWATVEDSRDTARKLGLATPSEGESQQLLELIECNLAALEQAPPRRFKEAG